MSITMAHTCIQYSKTKIEHPAGVVLIRLAY